MCVVCVRELKRQKTNNIHDCKEKYVWNAEFIIHQQWEMGIALGEVGLGERGLTVNQQIRLYAKWFSCPGEEDYVWPCGHAHECEGLPSSYF